MPDEYSLVKVPGLDWLTEVRLYSETLNHIAEEHVEFRYQLPAQVDGLLNALANPMAIHESTTKPENTVVFVSDALTYLGDPVFIPVRQAQGSSGRVLTAYFSSSTYPGKVLWSAGND